MRTVRGYWIGLLSQLMITQSPLRHRRATRDHYRTHKGYSTQVLDAPLHAAVGIVEECRKKEEGRRKVEAR
jgi:hypothetical protein